MPADFLLPTPEVARRLIGAYLLRATPDGWVRCRILETEAYLSVGDPASHSHQGQTPRNAPMFGLPGTSYVYFTYGSCHCLNVVTQAAGMGEAVLIRAVEPVDGGDWLSANRPISDRRQLTNGPGKLCQALALDRGHNGLDLLGGTVLRLEPGPAPPVVAVGRRVGISRAVDLPLRFVWPGHPGVSRPRLAP
ncbi:MAG: DNA-3-methyladenine glycosylase [Candidatus Sericytochromatia bacterium]|nr:DNA-3-methyladenine glycosylase [Candidatus Sericytochromatia bacterium]